MLGYLGGREETAPLPCGGGAAAGRFGPVEIGEGWFSAPREISRGIRGG